MRRFTLIVLIAYLLFSLYGVAVVVLKIPALFNVTPISTVLAFGFALVHCSQREGWRKTVWLAVIVFLTGLVFESIGVATGWVYGPYHYTDRLGPKFLGLVPYLIPLAWTMMMYPSLVIAERLVHPSLKGLTRLLAVAALGGMIMTAWDIVMDPVMVSGGHWVWEVSGTFFGVPLQNYWGWWLTTFAALAVYQAVASRIRGNPVGIPDRWAIGSYLITAGSTLVVAFFTALSGPALAGIFAMSPWLIMGLSYKEGR